MPKLARAIVVVAACPALLAPVVLAGCSADTQLTPKEAANVRGTHQMPPEARTRLAEKMAESQRRMQQNMPQGKSGPAAQPPTN